MPISKAAYIIHPETPKLSVRESNPLALKLLREKGVAIEQVTLDHKYVQSLADRLEKADNEK